MARKAQKLPKLWVRLPGDLHLRLIHLAFRNQRSLNSEIVSRLEHSVAVESPLSADAQRVLDRIEKLMDQIEFRIETLRKGLSLTAAGPEVWRSSKSGEDK